MDNAKADPIKYQENEVSPKEILLKLIGWIRFLLSKWLFILIIAVLGAVLGFFYADSKSPQYSAELTFVLEDNKGNPLGAYAGVASQFGIDLGAAAGAGLLGGDNITEYLKSRLLIEKTLLFPISYNGREQTLADLYIDVYKYRERWKKKGALAKLSFPADLPRKQFSLQQDSVLNIFHQNIVNKNLTIEKPDRKASFVAVTCTSESEAFSKMFIEVLVKEATGFYLETKTRRSRTNITKLQATVDSIETLLNSKTRSAAMSVDLNLNPARSIAMVGTELNTRDKQMLTILYAEVTKNLEIAKMTMAQETPLIQIIDTPILPLKISRFGPLKGIVLGGVLGGVMIVILLSIVRLYKSIMR
ncbi:hypothetical protein MKQ68_20345 [Chitinophaga horti]|uniref:Polysaccharide chain length determinant N-terminal domain-containing protein n=1 Tax=Chitinophaga horti TaxID=2920382 RepID=A0ABY6J1D4_9BACT|nr:Wzz/FepE/Etk N-terminal domain-containing protein [Chitinophaga horti]UYQ92437.1 hypothetical protein MKQ68_20345 [Chitinophaga horti]